MASIIKRGTNFWRLTVYAGQDANGNLFFISKAINKLLQYRTFLQISLFSLIDEMLRKKYFKTIIRIPIRH